VAVNKRRRLIVALGAGALAAPLAAFAQQPQGKMPRIGYLAISNDIENRRLAAFLKGLAELGYVEGKNIVIERRSAQWQAERLPALAAELAGLKVDVLVALDPPAANAAIHATRTIPIVMRTSIDPVAAGIIASLAHPGGNVTGLFSLYSELNGKRLEMLKESQPAMSRVMLLWDTTWAGEKDRLQVAVDAARKLRVRPLPVPVAKTGDFENAFKAAARERAGGLLVLRTPLMVMHTALIVKLAAQARLPAIYDDAAFVEAGGLMSYGASLIEISHRAANYVDKILKGTKPGDIPVEQPTRFELVVNRKTAKTLGVKFPNSIQLRIDRTIE
jgi:putative ABC transport system substrate-binding protein